MTNKPISFREQGLCFYYEVKILGMKPQFRSIGIGFCGGDQKRDKPLGNKRGSYSFMGNGQIFTNVKDPSQPDAGEEFSQCGFEEGDVIGCGFNIQKREIFYTKNGACLGVAFKDVPVPEGGLYAAVCLQSLSHHI